MISFTIPLRPVPKDRPRAGKSGIFYTPKKTKEYEQTASMFYLQAVKNPFDCPVSVSMRFYGKNLRGDIDNYIKSCLDAGNGIAWKTDKQVKEIYARIENDPNERTEITIKPFE